jgi:hypothetical protein
MLFSSFRRRTKSQKSSRKRSKVSLFVEQLEDRSVPSAFSVWSLNGCGPGSLSQAILSANANPGPNVINFCVAGTIQLNAGALPAISGAVDINGASAPGYAGTPVVEIDFNHFSGLQFTSTSAGSELCSLDLVNAAGAGVTVSGASNMLIVGDYIGVGMNGSTVAGNGGNGLELDGSNNNIIGGSTAQDRNVISGNGNDGILINDSSRNQVIGSFIGTDSTGALNCGNDADGILLTAGSTGNIIGDTLGNVISANHANGVVFSGANYNQLESNSIGTNVAGTADLGNDENGVMLTAGARGDWIGGNATGGNNPTQGVYVRPPQGNLISGNNADGVLITGNATSNTLSGNFIGTTASGDAALGNSQNGVAIVNASGNSLIGCSFLDNPFVYYNVISGNGGNGLHVTNSNNTTIQANFFGMGADNSTAVGNAENGVLVDGSSAITLMGGPIPLGNVDAANGQNGLVVSGTASSFTSYNTFCGLAAFSDNKNFGNGHDGMLITSTGGNILIRTNVITCNGNDGIEISGAATGVRVAGNIIGLNTQGLLPMGNINNGIEVDGQAHNDLIGGPQATFNIIPHNVISANDGNGVAIDGAAYDIQVNFSNIGTNLLGTQVVGNAQAGVYLGPGSSATTIGSADPNLPTVISGNDGDGILMNGTHGNTVTRTFIGTLTGALLPAPNLGNGIVIENSSNNAIGQRPSGFNQAAATAANVIAFNRANGVFVVSGSGNEIGENSIHSNALLGIRLGPAANGGQAAPTLNSVVTGPLGITVSGKLVSTPNTTFTIQLYANNTNEPSGHYYLGSETVTTNNKGIASFTFKGPLPSDHADSITATATGPNNNTSEFSAPREAASEPVSSPTITALSLWFDALAVFEVER